MLTLGSLFDGSGGFPLAGLLNGIKPLWASEIEPFAIRVTTKRLPEMKHLGSVTEIDGGKIEPVDIITFGSPCQDLSVAGQRAGLELEGGRSNLFYEAIRIIKEMRCATNGKYPTYAVWENVPGAFSSNKGADFRSILEAFCRVSDAEVHVPKPKKWEPAGEILGDGYSVAWRVLDAQFWGVPQRRKRIFLVADFASDRAGKILFESEGLSGNPEPCQGEGQGSTENPERGLGAAGDVCLIDHGGQRMDIMNGVSTALRATFGHPPIVLNDQGGAQIDVSANITATLRAQEHGHQPCVLSENHTQDSRYTGPLDTVPVVATYYGTEGNNQPLVYETSHNDQHVRANADIAATLAATDYKDPPILLPVRTFFAQSYHEYATSETAVASRANSASCEGGEALVCYGICAKDSNSMKSSNPHSGIYEATTSRTLDLNGGSPVCNQGGMAICVQGSLNCMDVHAVAQYKVRRLVPAECARLQGFPDWWCDGLETETPSDGEMAFWERVFKTAGSKRTRSQIIKWLKNPRSDSAEYKLWGNGIALPCASYVLGGIAYWTKEVL